MSQGQQDMCTGKPFDQLKLNCMLRYKMDSLTGGHNVSCNIIAFGM